MMSRMCVALVLVRCQRQNIEKPAHPAVNRTIARGGTCPQSCWIIKLRENRQQATPQQNSGWSLEAIYAGRKHLYDPSKTCSLRENVLHGLEICKWR
jgi:hypothetical protein